MFYNTTAITKLLQHEVVTMAMGDKRHDERKKTKRCLRPSYAFFRFIYFTFINIFSY